RPHREPVALVLPEPVPPGEHVHFPLAGLISVVGTMADGAAVAIGMSGREEMFSISAILGEDVPRTLPWCNCPAARYESRRVSCARRCRRKQPCGRSCCATPWPS